MQELLTELQALPAGTAEGCRQPLEYARARLPSIRRQFIRTEEESRQPGKDPDAIPPLTRGMTIDVRLGALVNSVTTALDEYRALASVTQAEQTDVSPSLQLDPDAPDVREADASARQAADLLGDKADELEGIVRSDSVAGGNLKRQMRDVRGLFSLTRIELRMPAFVPRWYRRTVDTIADYPRILRGTAKAVQMGVDVARPLADAWHHYEHGFSTLVLDSVERAASGLSAVARKWESEREEPGPNAASPPADLDLLEAHEMILRGETPPPSWRPWISGLDFHDRSLKSLAPLSALTALQQLVLAGTEVSDVAPLAGLTALQSLDLMNTQVSDVAPLAGLTALQRLDLTGTQVSDVAPLSHLSQLGIVGAAKH